MKKIRLVVYILLLAAMVAGCSAEPEKSKNDAVVIKDPKLKGFDKQILSTLANDSFVFDIENHSEKITELPVTIELYEKGKLVGPLLEGGIIGPEGEKKIRVVIAKQVFDNDKNINQKWSIANFSDGSETYFSGLEDKINNPSAHASTYANLPLELHKGEKKTIAALVSTSENGIATRDLEAVLNNPKATSKFNRAYLVRIEAK